MSIIVQHPKTFGFVPGELLLMAEIDGTHLHNPFTGPSSLSFFHPLSICPPVASPCKIIWVANLMFCRMLFYSAVLNHRCRWTGIINYHFIRNVTGCSNNRTPKKRIEAIKSSVCQDGLIFKNRGTLNHHKYWSHWWWTKRRPDDWSLNNYISTHILILINTSDWGFACQFINPRNDCFVCRGITNLSPLPQDGQSSFCLSPASDRYLFELLHVAFRVKLWLTVW